MKYDIRIQYSPNTNHIILVQLSYYVSTDFRYVVFDRVQTSGKLRHADFREWFLIQQTLSFKKIFSLICKPLHTSLFMIFIKKNFVNSPWSNFSNTTALLQRQWRLFLLGKYIYLVGFASFSPLLNHMCRVKSISANIPEIYISKGKPVFTNDAVFVDNFQRGCKTLQSCDVHIFGNPSNSNKAQGVIDVTENIAGAKIRRCQSTRQAWCDSL